MLLLQKTCRINYGMLTPLVEHYNHLYAKSESISGLLTSDACKTHRNLLDVNITVATILNILETQAKFQTEISFINWNENLSLISVQTSQLLETAFFDSEYFKYDTKNDPGL
ncbi:uncharacterized protein VICG_00558 [Vittaforma corneae ATCC 50505]|uniref:Uncharacterized protein n=1 Tax=Vittaforma corneae (strain ATCC 50505) TaxID=993615 RepID=L2GPA4_VITCO|nr:uncharacterized protein VICG_00558 [Vittaforma corneae ATCC 50505]ELA42459.1 hypothetical protein VICG_00558 [Vittaforma corneae ATCC 50505]